MSTLPPSPSVFSSARPVPGRVGSFSVWFAAWNLHLIAACLVLFSATGAKAQTAPNDDCTNPIRITDEVIPFSNIGATGLESTPCGDVYRDVWFLYQPSRDEDVRVEVCSFTHPFVLEVFACDTDCFCPPSSSIICDNSEGTVSCAGGQRALFFPATAMNNYLIRVGSPFDQPEFGIQGFLEICCGEGLPEPDPDPPPAPDNDACSAAFEIGDGTSPLTTEGATTEPIPACVDIENDIWFAYTAPCTGLVKASLADSEFDTAIAVYTAEGNLCPPTRLIACNDDAVGLHAEVFFPSIMGQGYLLRIGGVDGSVGSATLVLTCDVEPVFGGADPKLAIPTGLAARAGDSNVTLEWDENIEFNLAGYRVYRATEANGIPVPLTTDDPIRIPYYLDQGIPNNQPVHYQVSAVDASGVETALSEVASATPGVLELRFRDGNAPIGGAVILPISALNARGITDASFEAVINIPFDASSTSTASFVVEGLLPTALTRNWNLQVEQLDSQNHRVFTTNPTGEPLFGEGHLANLVIRYNNGLLGAGITCSYVSTQVNGATQILAANTPETAACTILDEFQLGDVNGDKFFNETDIDLIGRLANGLDPSELPFYLFRFPTAGTAGPFAAADMNADRIIDVADAVLAERMLEGLPMNPPTKKQLPEEVGPYFLTIGQAKFDNPGGTTELRIGVESESMEGIAGMTFGLNYDSTLMEPVNVETTSLTGDLTLVTSLKDYLRPPPGGSSTGLQDPKAGLLRVTVFSATNVEDFEGDWIVVTLQDKNLAKVGETSDIVCSNVKFAQEYGEGFRWFTQVEPKNGEVAYGDTPTPTPSSTPTETPTESPTESPVITETLTPTPSETAATLTETATLTPTFDFDLFPDGEIDSRDLLLLLEGVRVETYDAGLLLEFSGAWEP